MTGPRKSMIGTSLLLVMLTGYAWAADPTVSIAATDPNAAEATDNGMVEVSRTGDTSESLVVRIGRSGTALEQIDYFLSGLEYSAVGTETRIVIPPGYASMSIPVAPWGDSILEGDETVVLSVLTSADYTVNPLMGSATVVILDNAGATGGPNTTVTISAGTNALEPSTNGSFTITRSGDTSFQIDVGWVFHLTSTATSGEDFSFNPPPGYILFLPGETTKAIAVEVVDDTLAEVDETVVARLLGSSDYNVGSALARAEVKIVSDDGAPPIVSVWTTYSRAIEFDLDPAEFVVVRSGATTNDLVVFFSFSGTASEGIDYYTSLSGASVTIPAGEASQTVMIIPVIDSIPELPESVTLTLQPDVAYTVGAPDSATVNIHDNSGPPAPGVGPGPENYFLPEDDPPCGCVSVKDDGTGVPVQIIGTLLPLLILVLLAIIRSRHTRYLVQYRSHKLS